MVSFVSLHHLPSFSISMLSPPTAANKTRNIVLFVLTSMIFCVTWLARFCIWRPLYDSMMKEKNPKISSHWSQDNRNKFGETLTSATYFICSAMFVYNLLYPKAWLWEPKSWSQDIYPHVTIDADYKFFYLLYASRFIADFLLIFMEDRKWVSSSEEESILFCRLQLMHCTCELVNKN